MELASLSYLTLSRGNSSCRRRKGWPGRASQCLPWRYGANCGVARRLTEAGTARLLLRAADPHPRVHRLPVGSLDWHRPDGNRWLAWR